MDEELRKKIVKLEARVKKIENYLSAFYSLNQPVIAPGDKDELYETAVKLVKTYDRVSSSLLQRRLSIGFNRAARLIEQLEEGGVVGEGTGSGIRKVLVKNPIKS